MVLLCESILTWDACLRTNAGLVSLKPLQKLQPNTHTTSSKRNPSDIYWISWGAIFYWVFHTSSIIQKDVIGSALPVVDIQFTMVDCRLPVSQLMKAFWGTQRSFHPSSRGSMSNHWILPSIFHPQVIRPLIHGLSSHVWVVAVHVWRRSLHGPALRRTRTAGGAF